MPKSKLTKAKEISQETKIKVLERQHNRSISGVALTPYNAEFHHYIYRSNSGIGMEWNIVGLTRDEHRWVHDHQPILVNGNKRFTWDEFQILMRNHLILHYEGWSEEKCRYVRNKTTAEDYGIIRRDVWR